METGASLQISAVSKDPELRDAIAQLNRPKGMVDAIDPKAEKKEALAEQSVVVPDNIAVQAAAARNLFQQMRH